MEPVTHGPEFGKSPFPSFYHLLAGELLPFSHCWLLSSLPQPSAYTGQVTEPVNLQITPVLSKELPCISPTEKKRKEKEDHLSWINRCFVFDSDRCHSTLSGPLSFFSKGWTSLANWDLNPYILTCLLPSRPISVMQHCLDPLFFGAILKYPVLMQCHPTEHPRFVIYFFVSR